MNSADEKDSGGRSRPKDDSEAELTDAELRKLFAPLAGTQIPTKEDEDAAVARLQRAIEACVRREGPMSKPEREADNKGERDLTDEQLRELLAPLSEAHLPTPEERRAIVERLREPIKRFLKRQDAQP